MSGYRWLTVVRHDQAPDLVRFAATELEQYIRKLADFRPEVTGVDNWRPQANTPLILLGSPQNNPLIGEALGATSWPELSDQGFILRQVELRGQTALIVGGDSPVATLWAAYELIERWGVTFTPRGDILPETPIELHFQRVAGVAGVPGVDQVFEPVIKVRGWRGLNCEVIGMEPWPFEDYRRLISQLAKLKYNMLRLAIHPYVPNRSDT